MDEKGFDSINVVPLVDVMLVLLTIVLTTATFIAVGSIPVQLPKAENGSTTETKARNITIDRRGAIYLDDTVLNLEELVASLTPVDRTTPIQIRADHQLALQFFVDVLEALKQLGFASVSLQTERAP